MDDSACATPSGAGGTSPEMLACIKAVVEEVRTAVPVHLLLGQGLLVLPVVLRSLLGQLLVSSGGWVAKPLWVRVYLGISGETLTSWMYAGLGSLHWHAVRPLPCGVTLAMCVCQGGMWCDPYPLEACRPVGLRIG